MGGDALNRRRFLEFLAASPLLARGEALAQELQRLPDPSVWGPRTFDKLIASPREALDVFDFELVAHRNVPVAHFGYMASGVDDEVTLRANREGFQKFQLKPRRLVDVGKIDTRMELFGETYGSHRHRSDRLESGLP
jgi:4-hydroxymandelate oxidase